MLPLTFWKILGKNFEKMFKLIRPINIACHVTKKPQKTKKLCPLHCPIILLHYPLLRIQTRRYLDQPVVMISVDPQEKSFPADVCNQQKRVGWY